MPESVTDRPTKAHEYVFLMTKSERYYYDAEAIKEASIEPAGGQRGGSLGRAGDNAFVSGFNHKGEPWMSSGFRNRRSVWTISTKPYTEAHFATFPPDLPEICIKAGTSEKGCCPRCGAGWERVIERESAPVEVFTERHAPEDEMVLGGSRVRGVMRGQGQKLQDWRDAHPVQTLGWRPTCSCYPRAAEWRELPDQKKGETDAGYAERTAPIQALQHELIGFWRPMQAANLPGTVLDPFGGAGTTGMVAARLLRNAILIELNPRYCAMAARRIRRDGGMFVTVREAAG